MITAVCCNLIGNRLLHIFYICIECTPSKNTDIQLVADDLKLQISLVVSVKKMVSQKYRYCKLITRAP